ncbi:MAG TPA: hypothetical protein PLI18_02930 [Pirellulaceae bacterium]|nr:hypothetical protein [Pirellulaceae bacterium]
MSRPPITDSPWFWAYLFASVGLALVWISAPTWIARQARLERRAAGTGSAYAESGASTGVGDGSTAVDPSSDQASIERATSRLRTLIGLIAVVAIVAWIGWRVGRRSENRSADETASSDLGGGSPGAHVVKEETR